MSAWLLATNSRVSRLLMDDRSHLRSEFDLFSYLMSFINISNCMSASDLKYE